jgi:hypothetical protein
LFDLSSHKLFASRDVVFHENADKGDTGVWNNSNDIDDHVKIDAMVKHEHEQVQLQE